MDFNGASVNRGGGLSTADERPRLINAQPPSASFEIDLRAAQLGSATVGLGTSLPWPPLDDEGASNISEEPSLAEQLMWLGITPPLPIDLRPLESATGTENDSASLLSNDSKLVTRSELTLLIEVGLAPVAAPREELSDAPRSESIDPFTTDLPTLDPGLRFTPESMSPESSSPFSTMDERLLADLHLEEVRLPRDDQTLAQPTIDEELSPLDAPVLDAENTLTVDRPTGFAPAQPNEVHKNIPHAVTQSPHSPRSTLVELRTELSEVVRQVRTLVTERETRSTIQLEPAELGRLTLELVDASEGLRAHLSAEDPAVLRFLERNVQLLETEARLQGVCHMSFSVGADVSGGLGRGDPQQSEAEASFHKNLEWNTTQQSKSRSRRELDTNA